MLRVIADKIGIMKLHALRLGGIFLMGAVLFSSCKKEVSSTTGWQFNSEKWGGYEKTMFFGQETGPGLTLIEGGTFVMGNTEQDVTYEWNAIPRRVTVSSFYMDITEISNHQYNEYLYWLNRTFFADFPEVCKRALPDTLVWRQKLSYNEPFVEYYLRHPAYRDYPVVGVNWIQANEFCKWRTDRVNEMILQREGYLEVNVNAINEDNFNTEAYLAGQYEGVVKSMLPSYDPNGTGERKVTKLDGILLPEYRLPTEAEWEYAALALVGNNPIEGEELVTDRKIYPWNGHSLRYAVHGGWQGNILANFKRGRGDNMGVAGGLNDNADYTGPVLAYLPNDFGLYNMAGNVSEWVKDVYRPSSSVENDDLNPFRGNQFLKLEKDEEGYPVEKDSLGRLVKVPVTAEENADRRNYKKSDYRGYKDGGGGDSYEDFTAQDMDEFATEVTYDFGRTSLVNNHSRVYKGGSWNDRAYFLSPGTRRWLDEKQSTATLGFRCAMTRVGSPTGNNFSGGHIMKSKKER